MTSPLSKSLPTLFSTVFFLALPAMLVLDGCALNHTDRSILADHGVSVPLRHKMAHLAPLTLPEIVELSRDGLLPEYITQYLRASHEIYHITDHDGFWLNGQGVNSTVISYLFATPDLLARASDRMAILDWAPYFTPLYSDSFNTYGREYYYTERARASSPSTQAAAEAKAQQNADE
jgi:hypothetical protein